MSENGELRDLTDFLLEWRDTCAIDLCPGTDGTTQAHSCKYKRDGESDKAYVARIAADVAFVHRLADARFKRLVLQVRSPDKVGLAKKLEETRKGESPEDDLDENAPAGNPDDNGDPSDREDDSVENAIDELTGAGETHAPSTDFPRKSDRDPASGKTLNAALSDESNYSQEKLDSGKEPEPAPVFGRKESIRGQMVSEYLDLVQSWRPGEKQRTHAFHILELYLYDKQIIKGRPFKDHLFEVVASRKGIGDVWGYLYKRVIPTMVKKSFRTVTGAGENIGEGAVPPTNPTGDWNPEWAGAYQAGVSEAADCLHAWLCEQWPGFDINDKLALMCTIFEVSMNDPRVTAMTTVGRQAFYNRKVLAKKSLEYLYEKGFERDEVLKILAGPYQDILLTISRKDPSCNPFLDYLKKTATEAGK